MSARRGFAVGTLTAMAVLAGGITRPAGGVIPVRGEAADGGRPPRITVTEIAPPDGYTIDDGFSRYEIDERGTVLLRLDPGDGTGFEQAIWRSGTIEVVDPPGKEPWAVSDLSSRGRFVAGTTTLPDCDPFDPACFRAFLWHEGESAILPTDGVRGRADWVNGRGQVVGAVGSDDPGAGRFDRELVAWDDGELVRPPVDVIVGPVVGRDAVAVNDRGQVAIALDVGGGVPHAAVWTIGGDFIDLSPFGGDQSAPTDINDRGQVVGWWGGAGSPPTTGGGFLWHAGVTIDLGPIEPVDVNDRGQVLGLCADPDAPGVRACLWDDGELTLLGPIPIVPVAINDRGQVVGTGSTADGEQRAYLWQDGDLIDLATAVGATGPSQAYDINDRGQILGTVADGPSETTGLVVWTAR